MTQNCIFSIKNWFAALYLFNEVLTLISIIRNHYLGIYVCILLTVLMCRTYSVDEVNQIRNFLVMSIVTCVSICASKPIGQRLLCGHHSSFTPI